MVNLTKNPARPVKTRGMFKSCEALSKAGQHDAARGLAERAGDVQEVRASRQMPEVPLERAMGGGARGGDGLA